MKISDLKTYTVLGNSEASLPKEKEKKSTGQKILDAGTAVTNFLGGKAIQETFGAEIAKARAKPEDRQFITQPGVKETIGSGLQLGANFIPGAGTGANLATKIAIGAGAGYAFDVGSKMQQDKTLGETVTPGIGTAVGGVLPVAGAVVKIGKNIVTRLFKGLGAGLSGVPTETIERIVSNPKLAQQASDKIAKTGNSKVLEENARTIINGVSKVRQEARSAYGKAVSELKATDIDPKVFRKTIGTTLDKIGSVVKNGERILKNAEFDNPIMLKKANTAINKLSKTELNGLSLNKLQNEIDNLAFKTTGDDAQRLSFNAFVRDLSDSVKSSINQSTNKLKDINKAFSTDMQLTETIEDIFGNVNFKNLPEVVKASQKLENVFSQKGLAPDVVDTFLERIGVSAKDFKTTEAVRQISNKTTGVNAKGLSIGEITQQATSAVITPTMVKNIAIATGLAEQKVVPFLNLLKPVARNTVIQALLQGNQ